MFRDDCKWTAKRRQARVNFSKGTVAWGSCILTISSISLIVKWDAKKADKKVERLRKIVKEAAEQSHRSEIPEVHATSII